MREGEGEGKERQGARGEGGEVGQRWVGFSLGSLGSVWLMHMFATSVFVL